LRKFVIDAVCFVVLVSEKGFVRAFENLPKVCPWHDCEASIGVRSIKGNSHRAVSKEYKEVMSRLVF